ncbi:MAG: CHAT domain-containing protein [Actinomycetota bacterium]
MASVDQVQSEIARLRKEEADLRKKLGDARSDAAKASADAGQKRTRAASTSSASMARTYLRDAERLETKAADSEKKAADVSRKLADNSAKQATKMRALESAQKDAQRTRDREDNRRRQTERRHVQEMARLSQAPVQHIHEIRVIEPPKPERLRVLYLAANPDLDLRVDVEVRAVREAVRKALHRDLVEIDHRPAATPEDLLDGINELRPHVVHFSGHGGGSTVLFDDAKSTRQDGEDVGRPVSFDLLARALAATDSPPNLLVLNSCDSLDGADVLLDVVPAVIGMAEEISDVGAQLFAARFYSAIASAQSVGAAIEQGAVAVDLVGLDEGWKPDALTREGLDLHEMVLVQQASV